MLQKVEDFAEFYRTSRYAAFPQEHRSCGTLGLRAFVVDQQPHDFVDAATADWVLGLPLRASCPTQVDFGDGWRRMRRGRGDMLLVPPDTEVRYRVSGPTRLLVLALRPEALVEIDPERLANPEERFAGLIGRYFRNGQVEATCRTLWTDLARRDEASDLLRQGALVTLAGLLLRHATCDAGRLSRNRADIRRAITYIEDNLRNELRLADMASAAGLSLFHFSREFRLQTGHSPYRYLLVRRAAAARQGLEKTSVDPLAVARATGFNSVRRMREAIRRFPS
jgi:AraC family transcriptional regulator